MRQSAPLPPLLLLVAVFCSSGCSTTVQGGQSGAPDAAALNFPDGAPTLRTDAQPQILPCVEGDRQVSNPDDGTCYIAFDGLLSWQAAQVQCIGLGATLAIIESDAELTIVGTLAAGYLAGQPDSWLGATDAETEGTFAWVDSKPVVFENWRDGEPNNNGPNGTDEDCAIIEGDNPALEWDDRTCTRTAPSICERAPGGALP
jgi:hypothetical protein